MGPGESGHAETVEDIKIPVLKSLVYTTGRGGTVISPGQACLTMLQARWD